MHINADFTRRVVLRAGQIDWLASPMAGVERRPLDRIGGEVARATTIVRFAPGSAFSAHTHGGGEEYIVLDGVFQDEMGDFPTGSYVRNPPTSRHTPASAPGCTIFVKLWQFDPEDREEVHVDLNTAELTPDPVRPGVSARMLYSGYGEEVRLEHWAAGAEVRLNAPGGAELLVIDGTATESGDALGPQSWLRVPPGGAIDAKAGPVGTKIWIKTGHLTRISVPEAAGG
ncbi:MAG: cupin domain-containing protein [Albidovulum sp.]|uniref:cupin domain-containing protein n=1 Tax=Albidovulum sp. TaxID=1872424 RepID=UPI003CB1D9EF